MLCAFPDELKGIFTVSLTGINPADVISILWTEDDLQGEDVLRLWGYLLTFIRESSEDGDLYHILIPFATCNNYKIWCIIFTTSLGDFIQFCTRCRVVQGNRINVGIKCEDDHVAVHTCSRQIILSTKIETFEVFRDALMSVISDKSFTMV